MNDTKFVFFGSKQTKIGVTIQHWAYGKSIQHERQRELNEVVLNVVMALFCFQGGRLFWILPVTGLIDTMREQSETLSGEQCL